MDNDKPPGSAERTAMPKSFEPGDVEPRWRDAWAEAGLVEADPESSAPSFAMVIPPPNITGSLHIGHALNGTLQDILARWKRMAGQDVLWLPGTDHAGIATQNVVERQLSEEGLHRHDLGREAFEERVWEWREKYGDRILEQMRVLGFSCDWSRTRFTLDPGLSAAVRRVFVELYEDDLIYRGEYLVNWCPRCETAISDLEVKHREVDGRLWRIRYPLSDAADEHVEVETTRPETMLGDTALAVSPGDARYRRLVGQTARLPLIGRELPIVADDFVDPEFGTGIVKVTPAHDPHDYAAGERHDLERVQVIDREGRMTGAAGEFAGLDRFECRERVVERLREEGLLAGERRHRHAVGHCDRCDAVVEPLVSTQWFVRMEPLAQPALRAAEEGRVRFVPERHHKVYREWLTNIRDWCISRQLWWGHRIPAWHCTECDEIVVSESTPASCPACDGELRQDPDVLDTWFSSWLWPFSTLGWPDDTDELQRYYPTQVLVTAYDILFFWVARMIMAGLRFREEVPFGEVYLHGLVRNEEGVKMSKSRGTGVDPLDVVAEHGADSLRFTLASIATPGNDPALSMDRVVGSRAFCNKLWNASRFALMNLGDQESGLQACGDAADPKPVTFADRWILSATARLVPELERHLNAYRFDEAATALYQFIWHEFCDWYIEMAKVHLADDDPEVVRATRGTLLGVLEVVLRALHPFMPFITEEIWGRLPGSRGLLASAPWAAAQEEWVQPQAEGRAELLKGVVAEARRMRADVGLDPRQRAPLILACGDEDLRADLEVVRPYVAQLVPAEPVEIVEDAGVVEGAVRGAVREVGLVLPLEGVVDPQEERRRLQRALDKVEAEAATLSERLDNPGFVDNAPEEVVEQTRSRLGELESEAERLRHSLDALADLE